MQKSIETGDVADGFDNASNKFKLAATVAQFAEVLRKSYCSDEKDLKGINELAASLAKQIKDDKVTEFAGLVKKTLKLKEKLAATLETGE